MAKTPATETTQPAATPPLGDGVTSQTQRRSLRRSPNFPYIDLPTAIQRVRVIYAHEHRNATPLAVVANHWDYSPTSSSTDKVIGALNAYGLVETEGSGDNRVVRLTERALDILEDEREVSPDRDRVLREAALSPAIHRTIRDRFGRILPSDASLRTVLVRELDFNPKAVSTVIANYRATIEYAGLDKDDTPGDNRGDEKSEELSPQIEPGVWVQWTSQGVAQFEQPRKVLGLSDDQDYAFVEGTTTGIPVTELTTEKPAEKGPNPPPPNPFAGRGRELEPPKSGTKQDVFALDSGEVLIRWPESLTAADFEDIKGWLEILERKIGRSVKGPEPEKPGNN
jgi:hypothetical protein